MRVIPASELLDLWEHGTGKPQFERAVDILLAAFPDQSAATISGWSLGQRDAALFSLKELLFGDQIKAIASCPSCGSRLDIEFHTSSVRAPFNKGQPQSVSLTSGGVEYALELLPITTNNLRQAAVNPSRRILLQGSLTKVQQESQPIELNDLPDEIISQVGVRLAEMDPQSDIQLTLKCLDCSYTWDAPFDIVSFLWDEIDSWAKRTLQEVHLLASKYGWSEREILSLNPSRRQCYLQMVIG